MCEILAAVPAADTSDNNITVVTNNSNTNIPPRDSFHVAYILHFILGAGVLLPWNAFITAVDYFGDLYPTAAVNRTFAVAYLSSFLLFMSLLVVCGVHRTSRASLRINGGLVLYTVSLVVVPIIDAAYVKGRKGMYGAYDVTVGAVVVAGLADALVRSGIVGSAGELPEAYMHAVVTGTASSGVLVSSLRVMTKSIYPKDAGGLRKSANVYFCLGIAMMLLCLVCYNIVGKLPIVRYYKQIKQQALKGEERDPFSRSAWRSTLLEIVKKVRWFCFGMFMIYLVTMSFYPGFITEDLRSERLRDWYPIVLIASYNVFDLVGKILPAVYLVKNTSIAISAIVARVLFYPMFLGCSRGPKLFQGEIQATALTALLGLTNGYFTSELMILAPKAVPIQHAEAVGMLIMLFFAIGLVGGSVLSWFWKF